VTPPTVNAQMEEDGIRETNRERELKDLGRAVQETEDFCYVTEHDSLPAVVRHVRMHADYGAADVSTGRKNLWKKELGIIRPLCLVRT
jgi:hypothetical protein